MKNQIFGPCAISLPLFTFSFPSFAQDDKGLSVSAKGSASTQEGSDSELETAAARNKEQSANSTPWIRRHAPEDNMWELGVYGGLLFPDKAHELFAPDLTLPRQGQRPFRSVAPDFGLRAGYYPLRFVGVEGELGVMPTQIEGANDRANLWTLRAHGVAQLGLWRITPFATLGLGMLGVGSKSDVVGRDTDFAMHYGGGVKFYLNDLVQLRLDVRDVVSFGCDGCEAAIGTPTADPTFSAHHPEVLLGLSFTLGRRKNARPNLLDTDGDGILDRDDKCVEEKETFNQVEDEDGCPEGDRDGDGILDHADQCPDEAGEPPSGCPPRDSDGDGILDKDDQCVSEPETKNGFEDKDGCPDELPEEIAKFSGVIKGIYFDTAKATIKAESRPMLKEAVRVLSKFSDIRVKISGHTDSRGEHAMNLQLSRDRADAVRAYLVGSGIAKERIETEGFGPDQPIDSNETRAGRARNRRIEFHILD